MRSGMSALIVGAPDTFLTELPKDVNAAAVKTTPNSKALYQYIHCFTTQEASLVQVLPALKKKLEQDGMIWISWPKKAAKKAAEKLAMLETDLSEDIIRKHALSNGLVDVKVCAVDEIWSGLKLVIPVKDRVKK